MRGAAGMASPGSAPSPVPERRGTGDWRFEDEIRPGTGRGTVLAVEGAPSSHRWSR